METKVVDLKHYRERLTLNKDVDHKIKRFFKPITSNMIKICLRRNLTKIVNYDFSHLDRDPCISRMIGKKKRSVPTDSLMKNVKGGSYSNNDLFGRLVLNFVE